MNLESHVPSLELCREWKEVGGRQDTEFSWELFKAEEFCCVEDVWTLQSTNSILQDDTRRVAAPLASELMEWMKDRIDIMHSLWRNEWMARDKTYANIYWTEKLIPNALMKMEIELKKEEK